MLYAASNCLSRWNQREREASLLIATDFDVPSVGSFSLKGRATIYRALPCCVGHGYRNALHTAIPIPTNVWWMVPHRSPEIVRDPFVDLLW